MRINNQAVKNILVVRNDRFGEFLLNIPAFRALKETFVNSRITAVVNPYVKELAECILFIDEIIEHNQRYHSLPEEVQLIKLLKKSRFDVAVMLNPSKEFNIITYLSGIPVRVGYDRKWGFLLTHKIKDKKYLGEKHEIEYNLELVGRIGAVTNDKSVSLKIEDTDLFNGLGGAVALHPFTSDPVKQWPLENFSQLAKRLTQELGLTVVIVGGKENLGVSNNLFSDFNKNLINLTGKTTLKELAALLKKSKLLISGDSGPVHLACALGIPVTAIFRSDIPGKTAKRWGPWGVGHTVIEKNNLSDIAVDEVFKKAKEKLGR